MLKFYANAINLPFNMNIVIFEEGVLGEKAPLLFDIKN